MNVRAELEYQEKTLESMEFHIWHNHNGCALERQNTRTTCPEDSNAAVEFCSVVLI